MDSRETSSPNQPPNLQSTKHDKQYFEFKRWQLVKNLVVISVGFNLFFTAFNGLSVLQSTLNQSEGIGVLSSAIINGFVGLSALVLPKYVIKKIGSKYTLALSMMLYIPYIAANFYFTWATMPPTAIVIGLAGALLWSSQCTYVNQVAVLYNKQSLACKNVTSSNQTQSGRQTSYNDISAAAVELKENSVGPDIRIFSEDLPISETRIGSIKTCKDKYILDQSSSDCKVFCISKPNDCKDSKMGQASNRLESDEYLNLVSSTTARFFGFFGLVYRSSDLSSNLMSYYVLMDGQILDNITAESNCSCGASFCNVESNCFQNNLAEPSQYSRNILTGASLALAISGLFLVLVFLDELEKDRKPVSFSFSFVLATCKFLRQEKVVYLIPLSIYCGILQGFYLGDYTRSYIACAWGVYHVGLVTITYGLSAAVFSTVSGLLVKYFGRIPVIVAGGIINAAVSILMLMWRPLPEHTYLFFLAAGMIGATVGILMSQLRAFYGVIFLEDAEAAFAGFYLWDGIGYCIAFSCSNYICTYIKIYILLAMSTLGLVGYLRTEFMFAHVSKKMSE